MQTTTLTNGATVIIQSKSSFMGCRGTVTGKSLTHENMYLVTLKTCGRLFENVPFLANELHPVGEATPGDIERAWTNPEEGVYDYQADYRESKN